MGSHWAWASVAFSSENGGEIRQGRLTWDSALLFEPCEVRFTGPDTIQLLIKGHEWLGASRLDLDAKVQRPCALLLRW